MSQLQLTNIHKSFSVGTVNENHVLKGIDLVINKGDFITVIGGNGAGKSTLLNTISGNHVPDAGSITIGGEDVTRWSTAKRSAKIGYVFQDPRMGTAKRLTIQENMALAYRRGLKRGLRWGVKKMEKSLMKERLATLGLGLENRLDTEVDFLSGGQRQALTLLMATLRQPDILLLDEHTAALDPKTSQMVLSLTETIIAEQELTALMITHNMEDALKYGNRLIMLHHGRIVVDINKEQKASMSVVDLLNLFKEQSGELSLSDSMLLG
ncbi:ATP-binding cassette domain-containing protein [Aerococcaceae bacterium zg-ZJ1578]|uniref:ABC transporter ATP-binding protein n=1 Tax=Aerococcaceae TaxID=186827 RepID=UPI0013B5BB9E|nr:ATP-binding cassette domain-containing protein [Aerococcaceae bacterium zg-1578]MBR7927769.1 ATP-binding cassette domain-containing protein [Aerococcaceae bacterium zg-ZUI334]NEW64439.1 ATP-binding cassette domain-containing protein [Facklamia sp. 252]NEW67646.1 ATP-binding cassette domain-containing protein [Facklamia sp. 253]QQD65626.1 ATP-binding cassette domain-containing protein [Aerococcaceae bacterium zg-252]